jgi:uncharacterized protein YdhG (YjbR/CyaY superfamily)
VPSVQSTATNVDAYLAEVPVERRDVLAAIRRLCLEHLPGYEEGMDYGMPSYSKDGMVAFSFASQKNYISIYGLKSDAVQEHRAEFVGARIGKCCVRYTNPRKVDIEAVERLLKATAASNGKVC